MSFMDDFASFIAGETSGAMNFPKGPGQGGIPMKPYMPAWRGTSRQVCGLYPFINGTAAPRIGVPLGPVIDGEGYLCADPISWFRRGLISAPSAMVLALNGLGKSSMVRRMIIGHDYQGVNSMVLGDIKPDHVELIRNLGGQVITIGHGRGGINPLDAGSLDEAADLLSGHPAIRDELLKSAHERKKNMVLMLMHIQRKSFPGDREQTIIDEAINLLEARGGKPALVDLLDIIRQAPPELRLAALDRGSDDRYREVTEELEVTLEALLRGRMGGIFAARETTPMLTDRSVVFDVSSLQSEDDSLQAAVLLSCWSYGFATVEITQALADAGVAPRRFFNLIMDELWRALRVSSGMVDHIDALSRLNRQVGIGTIYITHSMVDFMALATEEDRRKASGLVERSRMLILGGVTYREIDLLRGLFHFSDKEARRLTGWNAPGGYDKFTQSPLPMPGMGKFMLKTSDSPGITFSIDLTPEEMALSEQSNYRWERQA